MGRPSYTKLGHKSTDASCGSCPQRGLAATYMQLPYNPPNQPPHHTHRTHQQHGLCPHAIVSIPVVQPTWQQTAVARHVPTSHHIHTCGFQPTCHQTALAGHVPTTIQVGFQPTWQQTAEARHASTRRHIHPGVHLESRFQPTWCQPTWKPAANCRGKGKQQ